MPRRLLVALASHPHGAASSDALREALWVGSAPTSAPKLLQVYISQLRKALSPQDMIHTRVGGYALDLANDALDARRFERLLEESRLALSEQNPTLAVTLITRGLALWRGPAYGEFTYEEFARADAERLEELRLVAVEERAGAELQLGRHEDVLPELQRLAAAHPLRERLHAHTMLALYRTGRQAEALDHYATVRVRLRDELGLEPGRELRDLQRRILEHDPGLFGAPTAKPARAQLPEPPNALLGREGELEELKALLTRDDVRLLVLTGAGGSGKTRLALEAARTTAALFANGAAFVSLAPLRQPDLVLDALARGCGVDEQAGAGSLEGLIEHLRSRELLLVVDNAEHVRTATPAFVELLAEAPRLTLLVTSRAVLHLSGEHVYPVEPLAVDAAQTLFVERARAADARFRVSADDTQIIRRICERLDCLPLAIELAAARTRILPPADMLSRLDPRLPLLAGGLHDLPARQQTLRATLDWSHGLLTPRERQLFRRVAVFAGGFSVPAVEDVCEADFDTLASLVEQSLVRRLPAGRFDVLETIRALATEKLDASGEAAEIGRRHAEHFRRLAESANLSIEAEGEQQHELVIDEQDNVRAALGWAVAEGQSALGLGIAVALENFWVSNSPAEGARWFESLLDGASVPDEIRARALRAYGGACEHSGREAFAEQLYEQSLAQYRTLGDERRAAELLHRLGDCSRRRGDRIRARRLLDESLAVHRRTGYRKGEAIALGLLGLLERDEGNDAAGTALLEQSAATAAELGFWWWQGVMLTSLSDGALERGEFDEADSWGRRALIPLRKVQDRERIVSLLVMLARTAAAQGRLEPAGRFWGAIEAEEARAPLHWAASERDEAVPLLPVSDPAFGRGRAVGRQSSLGAMIDYALRKP